MKVDNSIAESNTALSFEQALRIAADTHPSIAQRLSEQGASEYGATGARWQRWPGLSVSSSRGPLGSTLTELQLEQPLWSGGRITANINAAEARAEAARNSVAEARKVILERTINAYAEAMRLQSRLLIADIAITDFAQLSDMIDRRVDSGISPKADAINVRARLQQSQSERMQMALQLQNARTELELLLGRRFTALVVPPPLAKLSLNMDEALDIVLDTAPELARLNAEERVAEEAIAATRSSLSPSLALRYQRVFGGGTFYATDQVFVGVTYQPGNGLSSFSAISEAESRRTGAVYAREAARLDLINRVRSLWQQADSSRRELSILNELVSSTQQVYESCLRQFPVGRRTWLELLLARRDATQAQYALADIRWSGFASQLKLELVTGQLAARDYRVIAEPSP
jgi:adhesin transport system outer membrane protein